MRIYITKYALTLGIVEKNVPDMSKSENGALHVNAWEYYEKGEWFTKRTDAVLHAENIRKNKIAELKKSIERLEKIQF